MQNTIYQITAIFVCLISLLQISCNTSNSKPLSKNKIAEQLTPSNEKTSGIPELFQRNEKIQYEKEWDYIQNAYARNVQRINKNENDVDAYLNLANMFVLEARVTGEHGYYYPAALKIVDEAISISSISTDKMFLALNIKAAVQLSLHEFKTALNTGLAALALNDRNAQIYGVLTDCYVELGEYNKAVEVADKMISIKPDLRSYARISYLREIYGDTNGAIEAMEMAAKAGVPNADETAWTLLNLAELQTKYGNEKEAEHILNQILQLRNDYPFAIAAIGDLQLKNKQYTKAEASLNKAINIIPEVGFYVSLATLYKEQNRTKEFDNTVKEIFEMLADDELHGHNMNLEYASLYLNLLDDLNNAEKYVNLEYDKRPNNIDVNLLKAEIAYTKNEVDLAKKLIQTASITNSKNPNLLELKAKI